MFTVTGFYHCLANLKLHPFRTFLSFIVRSIFILNSINTFNVFSLTCLTKTLDIYLQYQATVDHIVKELVNVASSLDGFDRDL